MIHPFDTITLARTKLRTRKIRTAFTVVISGALFGLLLAALLISAGLLGSIEKLGREGVGEKYIVSASINQPGSTEPMSLYDNPSIVARVEQLQAERIAAKTAEARRLKIEYIAAEEDPNPVIFDKDMNKKVLRFEYLESSPSITQALKEYDDAHAAEQKSIAQYTQGFPVKQQLTEFTIAPTDSTFTPMTGGQEDMIVDYDKNKTATDQVFSLDQFFATYSSMAIEDDMLTKPYTTVAFDPKTASEIPIVVPFVYAEKALGLKKLPGSASSQQRIDRIKQVRNQLQAIDIDFCYRNTTSATEVNEALAQRKELAKNKDKKDYQKPSVTYNVPDPSSCGPVTVSADTRTASEKAMAASQKEFKKKFGDYTEPVSIKLRFQVVGIAPAPSLSDTQSLANGIGMIFASSAVSHWQIPASLFIDLPASLKPVEIFGSQTATARSSAELPRTANSSILEFAQLNQAQAFLARYGESKELYAQPYGSNALVMAQLNNFLRQIILWATAIISFVAIIILGSMIGRTVADGRRETAVFRAIGAKRSDITAVYFCYTILLSLRITTFVIILGGTLALAADYWLSPQVTPDALISFSAQNLDQRVSLMGLNSPYIMWLPLVIVGVSLLAMSLPLLTSVRRNPISDMRQE